MISESQTYHHSDHTNDVPATTATYFPRRIVAIAAWMATSRWAAHSRASNWNFSTNSVHCDWTDDCCCKFSRSVRDWWQMLMVTVTAGTYDSEFAVRIFHMGDRTLATNDVANPIQSILTSLRPRHRYRCSHQMVWILRFPPSAMHPVPLTQPWTVHRRHWCWRWQWL